MMGNMKLGIDKGGIPFEILMETLDDENNNHWDVLCSKEFSFTRTSNKFRLKFGGSCKVDKEKLVEVLTTLLIDRWVVKVGELLIVN